MQNTVLCWAQQFNLTIQTNLRFAIYLQSCEINNCCILSWIALQNFRTCLSGQTRIAIFSHFEQKCCQKHITCDWIMETNLWFQIVRTSSLLTFRLCYILASVAPNYWWNEIQFFKLAEASFGARTTHIIQTALPPIISLVLILISTNCPDRKHGREDMPGHVKLKTLTSIIT